MSDRLTEQEVDRALNLCLKGYPSVNAVEGKGAVEGDAYRSRQLHELLHWCLTEKVVGGDQANLPPDVEIVGERTSVAVRWWLTPYAARLLAEQHGKLSRGEDTPAEAVLLKPASSGNRRDTGNALRDKAVVLAMDDELAKDHIDSERAASKIVARDYDFTVIRKGKELPMSAGRIRKIYRTNRPK